MIPYVLALTFFSCTGKQKHGTVEPWQPTYTQEQLEVYMDIQRRCEQLLEIFHSGEYRCSIEPYEERKSLWLEVLELDPGVFLPKSLDECLSDLQNY